MFGELSGLHKIAPTIPFGQVLLGSNLDISGQTQGVYVDTGINLQCPGAGIYIFTFNVRGYVNVSNAQTLFVCVQLFQEDTRAVTLFSQRLAVYVDGIDATHILEGIQQRAHNAFSWIVSLASACKVRVYAKWDGSGTPTVAGAALESDASGYSIFSYLKIS